MDNSGIVIGIDIQEDVSYVCCSDKNNNTVSNVSFDGSGFISNPIPLSKWQDIIENDDVTAIDTLVNFVTVLLNKTKNVCGDKKLFKLCITVKDFNEKLLDSIAYLLERAGVNKDEYTFVGHEESFAYYAFNQRRELYSSGVMLLDYGPAGIDSYLMIISKKNGTDIIMESIHELKTQSLAEAFGNKKDILNIEKEIMQWLKGILGIHPISSIYLTGDGFNVEGFSEGFIKFLCNRRKVFAGQNLYVKGACYCAYEEFNKNYLENLVLACCNRVTTGIEMDIVERGERKRLRIVRPGNNWYMASRSMDFILDDVNKIVLIMKPCDGSKEYEEVIDISEIPYRTDKQTRINISFKFKSDSRLIVTVKDKGFGEFVKSSGKILKKQIELV